jgi:hypothetical protein
MSTKTIVSATAGTQCKISDGGPNDGMLQISGITGRTLFLAGHFTEVTLTFHCPPGDPPQHVPVKVPYDSATGIFLPFTPIVVPDPCGANASEPAIIKVLHEFKDGPGGTTLQQLLEKIPADVACPLTACPGPAVTKAARKQGKAQSKKATKAKKPAKKTAVKKKGKKKK